MLAAYRKVDDGIYFLIDFVYLKFCSILLNFVQQQNRFTFDIVNTVSDSIFTEGIERKFKLENIALWEYNLGHIISGLFTISAWFRTTSKMGVRFYIYNS